MSTSHYVWYWGFGSCPMLSPLLGLRAKETTQHVASVVYFRVHRIISNDLMSSMHTCTRQSINPPKKKEPLANGSEKICY